MPRPTVNLAAHAEDPALRLLHVRCGDGVGFLFKLSELLTNRGIDVEFAEIATVDGQVDNKLLLRSSVLASAELVLCRELEEAVMGKRNSAATGLLRGNEPLALASKKLAVNPDLLTVTSFTRQGEGSANQYHYSLELRGINQAGLLAYTSLLFFRSGFSIERAIIATRDGQVSDTFELVTESEESELLLRSFLDIPTKSDLGTSLPWGVQRRYPALSRRSSNSSGGDDASVGGIERAGSLFAQPNNHSVGGSAPVHFENGDIYEGGLTMSEDGYEVRQGFGIYTYTNPRSMYLQYRGQWQADQKQGHGIMLLRDGGAFVGQWEANRRHGVGVMFGTGGTGQLELGAMALHRYEGEWEQDVPSGLGVEETEDSVYCGEFSEGCRSGRGMRLEFFVPGLSGCSVLRDGEEWEPLAAVLNRGKASQTANEQQQGMSRGQSISRQGSPSLSSVAPMPTKAKDDWSPTASGQTLGVPPHGETILEPIVSWGAADNMPIAELRPPPPSGPTPTPRRSTMGRLLGIVRDTPALSRATPDVTTAFAKPYMQVTSPKDEIKGGIIESPHFVRPLSSGAGPLPATPQAEIAPRSKPWTSSPKRARSPEGHAAARAMISCPMLWGTRELALLLECLGVSDVAPERMRARKTVKGTAQLLDMDNSEMARELGLLSAVERLVVRRALQRLLEADRVENSAKGRTVRDVLNDTVLSNYVCPLEELKVEKTISQGGFGTVFRGILTPGTDRGDLKKGKPLVVAVKQMKGHQQTKLYELLKEARVMANLHHPNICKFIGVCADETSGGERYILSELMDCSLFDLVHRPSRVPQAATLTLTVSLALFQGICAGIVYLHNRSLVHADLKSSNILVELLGTGSRRQQLLPRICDFGHAAVRTVPSPHSRLCTPQWAAPEVLRGEGLGAAADVFSFGVIMWETLVQQVPHGKLTNAQIQACVGWAGYTPDMDLLKQAPSGLGTLILECCNFRPDARPPPPIVHRRLLRVPHAAASEACGSLGAFLAPVAVDGAKGSRPRCCGTCWPPLRRLRRPTSSNGGSS